MGAVAGYGDSLQESCLEGFNSLGFHQFSPYSYNGCLLYTSDAADEEDSVDLIVTVAVEPGS